MPQPCPQRVRRGVTLLELLVVLTLMGVAAALVAPAFGIWPASAQSSRESDGAVNAMLTAARREAIRRAEPLRVLMAADGRWVLASQRSERVIDSGHVVLDNSTVAEPIDVLIDALGTCLPPAGMVADVAFDMFTCAPESTRPLATSEAR